MKKLVAIGVLLSLLLSGVAMADDAGVQELPGTGWWSAEALQNVGDVEANVTGTAYDMDAPGTTYQTTFDIAAGGAVSILPEVFGGTPVFPGMDGHRGSAVFSSNQPLVATVNLTNREVTGLVGVSGGYAAGVYEGTDGQGTGTTISFPIAKNNYGAKDTTFFVQNAGSAAAVINATFYDEAGTAYTWSSSSAVEAGVGVMIPSDPLPDGALGSAVVTCDEPLAGVYTEHESNESGIAPSVVLKTTKAFVPADGDDVLFAPAFKKGYVLRSSAIGVQAQADGVSGQIVYTCAGGDCTPGATFTVSYGPLDTGETYVAWPYNTDHDAMVAGFYSARVTSTGGNVVATVSETYWPDPPSPNRDSTYSAIPEHAAATNWFCPVVKERYFQNAGAAVVFATGSNVTVDVIYSVTGSESGSYVGNAYVIDDYAVTNGTSAAFYDVAYNGTPNVNWLGDPLPSDTGVNAAVTVQASAPVVVTSNENVHYLQTLQQDAKQYSCFPVP